jgi:hypothetical protein
MSSPQPPAQQQLKSSFSKKEPLSDGDAVENGLGPTDDIVMDWTPKEEAAVRHK